MNEDTRAVATPSQTVGPFFHSGLPPQAPDARAAGERIRLLVMVTDGDGRPVDDAVVEFWHAASVFARRATRQDGTCEFEIPIPDSQARQAAHVNVCLFARGLLRQVHTRIYFDGDTALRDDPVLALVPPHRRSTLLARRDAGDQRWLFDLRLQGPRETVFFAM